MSQPQAPANASGFLLHDVARLMRKNFNRRVSSIGMTQEQCRVILQLSRHEGIQQVGLAELLEIKPITLARLLDKLEEHELIERRRDQNDRRAFCLYLTSAAHAVLKEIMAVGVATRVDANRNIPAEDLEVFFAVLGKLKTNLIDAEERLLSSAAKAPD